METKKIGWIGTGVMGKPMCAHLIKAGLQAFVFNRTRGTADELVEMGAVWCDSPAEIAQQSDIVFSIVGYPSDVEEIYFGKDGVLSGSPRCSTIVDMTTSEPSLAQTIADEAAQKSINSLDAPVSGGQIGAEDGKLAIMVGGEETVFQEVLPFFQVMGENIALMGKTGAGQHTKMANQIKIASTMIGMVESLLYGYKAGLDLNELLDVIGKGAAASWSLNVQGRNIARGNFEPGFFIKHFVKDMEIALAEAKRMQLPLPGLAMAHQFYISAMALGYENLGTQALYKVFQGMGGISD
ncbi:MAG: NAD(P)-dependent oxidoreductase [Deltaproteobacteria bacterium]|jgi:3-hydroxyisobutyrate dehydrogenase|nr:NAD(P)-dependent oxidoreductase [Deltaproteobacteria bacterium]MBT4637267.1 NAD(P)-dependent oxidoreductase [Deltaproteobacteria bacterium]MBT6502326.1 NAD(P)-dependent oxidoreductase [Deltaproteobacteria bacterium]MBT6612513.1 NAD(P)-dependent oxidoreductase [Deltaproteobacteria bacterium]MBT7153714.1 NAD(P)-dependent oxidoreductase [Deltaproteobacteria bacterium]